MELACVYYFFHVFIFRRSRPVVKVEGKAAFYMLKNKEIVLEEKGCVVESEKVPCTMINTCFRYHGTGVPREIGTSNDVLFRTNFMFANF